MCLRLRPLMPPPPPPLRLFPLLAPSGVRQRRPVPQLRSTSETIQPPPIPSSPAGRGRPPPRPSRRAPTMAGELRGGMLAMPSPLSILVAPKPPKTSGGPPGGNCSRWGGRRLLLRSRIVCRFLWRPMGGGSATLAGSPWRSNRRTRSGPRTYFRSPRIQRSSKRPATRSRTPFRSRRSRTLGARGRSRALGELGAARVGGP